MNFKENLKANPSVVAIRQIFDNGNDGQLTVQFQQMKKRPTENVDIITAMSQGLDPDELGVNYPTCLRSFSKSLLETKGHAMVREYTDGPLTASDVLLPGIKVAIQVVENTTKNPDRPNQQPKKDLNDNILTFEGKPIYVHNDLVLASQEKTVYLNHDGKMTEAEYNEYMSANVNMGSPVFADVN